MPGPSSSISTTASAVLAEDPGAGPAAELHGVLEQVGDQPAQRHRVALEHHLLRRLDLDVGAGLGHLVAQALDQRRQLQRRPLGRAGWRRARRPGSPAIIASIWSMSAAILVRGSSGDVLDAEAQAGQRRAQVVGDGADHGGAVLDVAAQPLLHVVEGAAGDADLRRALAAPAAARAGSRPSRSAASAKAAIGAGEPPGEQIGDRRQGQDADSTNQSRIRCCQASSRPTPVFRPRPSPPAAVGLLHADLEGAEQEVVLRVRRGAAVAAAVAHACGPRWRSRTGAAWPAQRDPHAVAGHAQLRAPARRPAMRRSSGSRRAARFAAGAARCTTSGAGRRSGRSTAGRACSARDRPR